MAKKQTSLRLTDLTSRQLEALTKAWGMNQTEVITVLVDRAAQKELNKMYYDLTLNSTMVVQGMDVMRYIPATPSAEADLKKVEAFAATILWKGWEDTGIEGIQTRVSQDNNFVQFRHPNGETEIKNLLPQNLWK